MRIPLFRVYCLVHPVLAYALWSLNKLALKAERLLTALFIAASLFLYGMLNPAMLIISTVLYVYCCPYSFRPDVKKAFE